MSPIRRLVLGLVIALAIAFALMLIVEHSEGKVPYDCVDPTERERVRDIVLKGIDDGLEGAMEHLFDIWQRDPNTEQPRRAQVGTTNAINAHNRARRLALDWDPPSCPP